MMDLRKRCDQAAAGQGDAPPAPEAIIRRDRRRVRIWAGATAALWIMTALYLFVLLWVYVVMIHPVFNEFFTTADRDPSVMVPRMYVVARLLEFGLYWPVFLVAAAVCSVCFTVASRRATLRQIQIGLAEISSELRGLTSEAVQKAPPPSDK